MNAMQEAKFVLFLVCLTFGSELSWARQRFLRQPSNTTINQGASKVMLRCAFNDLEVGISQIQWLKNNFGLGPVHAIKHIPRYSVVGNFQANEFNLQIEDVQLSDEGMYSCQASPNAHGKNKLKSRQVLLKVLVPPKHIEFSPRDSNGKMSVQNGAMATVSCSAISAKPPAIVTISLNGKTMRGQTTVYEDDKNPQLSTTKTTIIFSPKIANNNDVIKCNVTHAALHSPTVSKMDVNVLYAPSPPVLSEMRPDAFFDNDVYVIKCTVQGGNPTPLITWFMEEEELTSVGQTNQINTSYSILRHRLRPQDDTKLLTCRVTSDALQEPLQVQRRINVYYWPANSSVTQRPEGVAENQSLEFKCQSSKGNPQPELEWFKEDEKLEPVLSPDYQIIKPLSDENGVTSSLVLHDVTKNDVTVTYKCKISVKRFEKVETLTINPLVYYPPSQLDIVISHTTSLYTQQMDLGNNQEVKAFVSGSQVYFKCSAKGGFPDPEVGWFINNRQIESSKEAVITQSKEGEMMVSRLKLSVAKSYNGASLHCASTNPQYATQTSSKTTNFIVVYQPDKVEIENWPQIATHGQTLSLTCRSSSSFPPANITWYKGDSKITNSDSIHFESIPGADGGFESQSVMNILPTFLDDESLIECRAGNGISDQEAKMSVRLNVTFKPHFEKEFQTIPSKLGKRLEVDVKISSNPVVAQYRWMKLVPISSDCSESLPTTFQHSNFIENGDFEFKDLPDILPTLKRCAIGGNTKILTFSAISRQDRGIYELTTSNEIGQSVSYFVIDVIYPPTVRSIAGPTTSLLELEKAVMRCDVNFHPKTNVTAIWMHKTGTFFEPLQEEKLTKGKSSSSYTIQNVTSRDRGLYKCKVTSLDGINSNDQNFKLDVSFAPLFLKQRSPSKVVLSRRLDPTLQCTAIGSPKVDFVWFHEGRKILKDDERYSFAPFYDGNETYRSVLTVRSGDEKSLLKSKFSCIAENTQGKMKYDISIVNEGPPDAPINLSAFNITNDSLVLSWEPQFNGGVTQTFLVQYIALSIDGSAEMTDMKSISVPTNHHRVVITKLRSGFTYAIYVTAINQFGKSPRSKSLRITTSEPESHSSADLLWKLSSVSSNYAIILSIAVGIFVVMLIVIGVCVVRRRRAKKSRYGNKLIHSENSSRTASEPGCSISTRGSARNSLACSDHCDGFRDIPSSMRQSRRSIKSLPEGKAYMSSHSSERRSSLDHVNWNDRLSPCLSSYSEKSGGARRGGSPHSQHSTRFCVRGDNTYASVPTSEEYEMEHMPPQFSQVEPVAELNARYLNRQYHTLLPHERPISKLTSRGRYSYVSPPSIPEEFTRNTQPNDDYSINVKHLRSASSYDTRYPDSNPVFVRELSSFGRRQENPTRLSRDRSSMTSSGQGSMDARPSYIGQESVNTTCERLQFPPNEFMDKCQPLDGDVVEGDKDSGCGDSSNQEGVSPTEEGLCDPGHLQGLLGRFQIRREGNQTALFV